MSADSLDPRAAALRRKISITRLSEDLAVFGLAGVVGSDRRLVGALLHALAGVVGPDRRLVGRLLHALTGVVGPNRRLVRGRLLQAAQRIRLVNEPVRRQTVRQILKDHQRAVITHEVTGPVLPHVHILKAAYGPHPEHYWHAELCQTWTASELAERLADFQVVTDERGRNDRQQQILKALEGCPFDPAVYSAKLTIFWLADNPNTWGWLPWTLLRYVAQQPAQTVLPKFSDTVEAASKGMGGSHVSIATSTAPRYAASPAAAPGEGTARPPPLGEPLPPLDDVIIEIAKLPKTIFAYKPAANPPVNVGTVSPASEQPAEPVKAPPEKQEPLPDEEAKALRESVIRDIKDAGKNPGTKGYSWDQFVGEVKTECRAREDAKGFSRTNLWRMYNRLKT